MKASHAFAVELPDWCRTLADELPDRLPDATDRMRLAIDLSRRNVSAGTGGPFGAVVSSIADGRLIAIGVNRVEPETCSSAHAEIVALSLAQATLSTWNLADAAGAPMELATSCEPCAMCLGAIPWSGVQRVVCGATKRDAEITGFDEGERPGDWIGVLNRRGIDVQTEILQADAAEVLAEYRRTGARIYNP
ncbi:MAG: tRNA-specific adenosine deaminase [Xanthomonadales bacterium]|nr:tRNA-specific adenosine deaminase [Xanthomonadales bacterium]